MKQVLRFTAAWCGPCKMLAKTLENVESDTPIVVVDIDADPDAAKKYGVRGVPTLIKVDGDTEVSRLVGVKPEAELRAWINA